jgi:hypothetical protein
MDEVHPAEERTPGQASWQFELPTTALDFCMWLDGWIVSLDKDMLQVSAGSSARAYFRYGLSPYIDLYREYERWGQPFDLTMRVATVDRDVWPINPRRPELGNTVQESQSEISDAAHFLGIHETAGKTSVKVVCEPSRAIYLEDIVRAIYEKWPSERSQEPESRGGATARKDHGHFSMDRSKRQEIVQKYRAMKASGRVSSQAAFALQNGISERTLRNWLDEFPPEPEKPATKTGSD